MKNKMIAICISLALLGCRKDPDLDALIAQPLVASSYDKTANFASYKTYFVSDTVTYLTDTSTDTIITGNTATQIVSAFKKNMSDRGYQFVARNQKPDLGVRLGVIKDLNVDVVYYDYWDYYPYYYDPAYWGYNDWGYYYPYSETYAYSVGTLISSIIDLKNAVVNTQGKKQLTVLWTSAVTNALGSDPSGNLQDGINGLNQAFLQSPYLKTN